MIKSLPLLDKKVLVPRGENQAKSFSQLVEKYGGIPIEIPLIAFRPIERNQHFKTALKALDTYDWIIFTSNVTVETFFSFFEKEGLAMISENRCDWEKNGRGFDGYRGFNPQFVPSAYVAEMFVEEFLPLIGKGCTGAASERKSRPGIYCQFINRTGAHVDEVVIYETYMPDESRIKLARMLADQQLDILTFTSPSTVDHFMAVVKEYRLR